MTPPEPRGGEGLSEIAERVIAHGYTNTAEYALAKAYLDRPTAPSATGGEAVAWRHRRRKPATARWVYSEERGCADLEENYEVQPLFAHPARMPTREEVARIIDPLLFELKDALDSAEGEPEQLRRDATEHHDRKAVIVFAKADAILALFQPSETKGGGA